MVGSLPAFSGVPNGTSAVLDLTADLAPLLVGLWVLLGLCVLGLTVVTAIHDTWWEPGKRLNARIRCPKPPRRTPSTLPPPSVIEPALFEFAEELSFAEVVPFESSPLSLQSLASIALKAARGGAAPPGAVTAYVAVGQTPILLVAVPAGIVLCGGAIAFGKWPDRH